MRARFVAGPVLTLSLALAACGEDDPAGPLAEYAGTYDLVAVDGEPLPYVYEGAGFTLTYTDGELDLDADGNWSDMIVFTVQNDGEEAYADTTTRSGTYEEGDEFDLVLHVVEIPGDIQADVDGDRIEYPRGAIVVTFED